MSPDGKLVAFVSDREPESNNDADLWVRDLAATGAATTASRALRVTRMAGVESFPAWAPDNARIAYAAARAGGQNDVWVSVAPPRAGAAAGGRGVASQDAALVRAVDARAVDLEGAARMRPSIRRRPCWRRATAACRRGPPTARRC